MAKGEQSGKCVVKEKLSDQQAKKNMKTGNLILKKVKIRKMALKQTGKAGKEQI